MATSSHAANVLRFNRGFSELYHRARPSLDISVLRQLVDVAVGRGAGHPPHSLVVDIGAGTGLSTLPWAPYAARVVGVEPSDDMRAVATTASIPSNVEFVRGTSAATGLPTGCADVVTAAQALHWMPPAPTFAEVARILKPRGGVFVAYDCDWPPLCGAGAEAAYARFIAYAAGEETRLGASPGVVKYGKDGHAGRMEASGLFAHVSDVAVHQAAQGSARDLLDIALSQGGVQATLGAGATMESLGADALLSAAAECFCGDPAGVDVVRPWLYTYRVRIGVMRAP